MGEKRSSSGCGRLQPPVTGGVIVGDTPPFTAAVNVTPTVVFDATPVAPADGDVDATLSLPTDAATAGDFAWDEHDTPRVHTTPVAPPRVRA